MLSPVFRPILIYLIALTLVRLMGKRALGELSLFDLVIMAGIGDVITLVGLEKRISLSQGLFFLGILGGMEILLSMLSFRFPRLCKIIEGSPTLLIKHGRVIQRNLRLENISVNDLYQELRRQGIEDPALVERAVFESSGHFSVILKKPFENTSCNSQTQELAAIHEELAAIHQRLEKMGKEEPP
jgi:uncharacterized membrane protein YcaP (DUF421 family)